MACRLELEIANNTAALAQESSRARAVLSDWGVGPRAVYAVDLVLEELVGNIIRYAYGDGAPHTVGVAIERLDGALVLTIEDDGRPFDPAVAPTPARAASLEEAQIGGQGIHMVRRTVADLSYHRTERGNCVRIRIDDPPPSNP
jgi:anti-sigma regulatory factor (Ser/Thr protein kinase)